MHNHFVSRVLVFLLLVSGLPGKLSAQTKGAPFITNFNVKKYYSTLQSWAITQGNDGVMYFGLSGILEYNGVHWTKINIPATNSVVRSLTKDSSGRIYYGAAHDFGYLYKDSLGNTKLRSLLSYISEQDRNFNDVWSVIAAGNTVYFQSRERIFRFTVRRGDKREDWEVKTWVPVTQFMYAFYQDGIYYVHQQQIGFSRIINDSIVSFAGSEFLGKDRVQVMLPYPSENDKKYLVGSFNSGLYLFDGKSFAPFPTDADFILRNSRVYKGILLEDGNYALATSGKGLVIIDRYGKLISVVNQQSGLQDELVRDIYQDNSGSVWLALDRGISRLETSCPLTQYVNQTPLSNMNAVRIMNGVLYISCSTGLLKLDNASGNFEKIKSIPSAQAFELIADGQRLLTAANGIYSVENERALLIESPAGNMNACRTLYIPKQNPDVLIAGISNAVLLFRRISQRPYWKFDTTLLKDLNSDIMGILETTDGSIWLPTFSTNEFFRINQVANDNSRLDFRNLNIRHYKVNEKGLNGNNMMGAYLFKNELTVHIDSAVYRFHPKTDTFIRDSVFTKMVASAGSEPNYVIDSKDRVWLTGDKGSAILTPTPDGGFNEDKNSVAFLSGLPAAVLAEKDVSWIIGADGLVRFDERRKIAYNKDFKVLIHRVASGNDTISNSAGAPALRFNHNSVRFDYAAAFYILENQTLYQTWMEGFEAGWSDWGTNSYKEYTNLSEGNYVFHVRAKNVYGKVNEAESFAFAVLPPWYRTRWAYILWSFLIISATALIVYYRSKKLSEKNRILEEKVALRTGQLNKSIEDLKSAQAQLVQSEKMASLGELTAGIAHEIQNPLNFVNNFSEVSRELIDEMKDDLAAGNPQSAIEIAEDLTQNLEKINHHGKRAAAIVKGMLQHSRTEKGQKELVDVNALADEYLRLSYHGIRAKDNSFHAVVKVDYDESIGKIDIVPQDIGRVLLNLYNNAFYAAKLPAAATRLNGSDGDHVATVWVKTRKEGNKVLIAVKDNGPGIPENIIKKIFQPFFTTKPTGEGTGLGLSLSYDTIKAHGGEIWVETKENEGTEFLVRLPVGQAGHEI